MISVREQLVHGAKDFVRFLNNSNINLFLLSGDGELSTINNLNHLHICEENEIFKLT
jgi:predicted secreted acid phosphatase